MRLHGLHNPPTPTPPNLQSHRLPTREVGMGSLVQMMSVVAPLWATFAISPQAQRRADQHPPVPPPEPQGYSGLGALASPRDPGFPFLKGESFLGAREAAQPDPSPLLGK